MLNSNYELLKGIPHEFTGNYIKIIAETPGLRNVEDNDAGSSDVSVLIQDGTHADDLRYENFTPNNQFSTRLSTMPPRYASSPDL